MRLSCVTLFLFLCFSISASAQEEASPDAQTVQNAYLKDDKAVLLDYLKKRTQKTADAKVIEKAIKDLDSKEVSERDAACMELVKQGLTAVPALRRAINNVTSADATQRARKCLAAINSDEVTLAVLRLLSQKKPEGSIEAILAFAPFVENEDEVGKELKLVLETLASRSEKVDKALLDGLKDESPIIRGVAAEVVSKIGSRVELKLVLPLLKDPKPAVRFQAARSLADRYEPAAVPTLIELLDVLAEEDKRECEDYLTTLAGEWRVKVNEGSDSFSRELQKAVWTAWWKALQSDKLIAEIEKRVPSTEERATIQKLITQLTAPAADARDQATNGLLEMGLKAVAMLRQVAEDTDSDKGRAASRVLVLLEKDGTVDQIPATAINILALQSSEKAVPTLLAFLPYASTEAKETIREVLRPLAARMEGSGPILVKAMSDPIKERRIAAVEALASLTSFQTKAREALKDKDIGIRTAAALALADARDKEAVPVLINLLAEAPAEKAWEIESYLARIAGPSRPTASLGTSGSNAKTVSDEWMKWWNTNKATVSLVRSRGPRHFLGYTLVVEYYNSQTNRGRVLELDRNGKVRWEIGGMSYPYDAKILGHNRVMIAEQNLNRLTIRDFKGKVIKNITVNQPCVCQKLKNGRIFVAGRYEFVIADQKGNRISQQRVSDYVMHARRMKNGEFVYVNSSYYYRRVDDKGRVKKSFQLPRSNLGGSRYAEVLPNGNVLLTMYSEKRVLEIDPNGKTVWEAKNIPQPYVATRLKNGNTLISCRNLRKVVEVNRAGKIVKEITKNNFYPYKAYKR